VSGQGFDRQSRMRAYRAFGCLSRRQLAVSTMCPDDAMSNHDHSSCSESRSFCDRLFDALSQRIEGLQRTKHKTWCCFFQPGRMRFAYVTHRMRTSRIEVWALGKVDALSSYASLKITPRAPTTGTWGKNYPTRFRVESASQLKDAEDFLFHVSYPKS
jgi:hypothetical protein